MSINGNTVSLKTIVERVYMDFGFNYSLSWNEAAEWAGSILALLKAPVSLEDKFCIIKIEGQKGKLPEDLESLVSVAYIAGELNNNKATPFVFPDEGSFLAEVVELDKYNREAFVSLAYNFNDANDLWCRFPSLIPMKYTTDLFYKHQYHCTNWDLSVPSNYTYKVNNGYIFPNFENGRVLMAYRAIPTDCDGFPLIPSDEKWRTAVMWEIAYKIAKKLWIQGNLEDKRFQFIERDRDWYVAQAGKHSMSVDEMTSLKNSIVNLIPNPHEENNFFRNLQFPEQRYNHPLRLNR